ncbi:unnamed protein product [Linum tenue]|uniref:Uncharacterized protein n=1 Tax=Linum tenue TaxID=586396 RepID=A0AAV0LRI0_9ROSI|nr:unnamed protein product [Linum tenue]
MAQSIQLQSDFSTEAERNRLRVHRARPIQQISPAPPIQPCPQEDPSPNPWRKPHFRIHDNPPIHRRVVARNPPVAARRSPRANRGSILDQIRRGEAELCLYGIQDFRGGTGKGGEGDG